MKTITGALLSCLFAIPASAARPSTTPTELADQVSELRVFLTTDPKIVVGEIVTLGGTTLTELAVPLEDGVTRFMDNGVAPDRLRADGVFTARFPMNTMATFMAQKSLLAASTQALTGDGSEWVTRGPRDTVRARAALETLRAARVPGFDTLAQNSRLLLAAQTPHAGAAALGLDTARVPFLTLPSGHFVRAALAPDRMFGVPFFKGIPLAVPLVPIDEFRSLMIVHTNVLDDPVRTFDGCTGTGTPGGVWSFGHLIREMSFGTGMTPEDFLMDWLNNWNDPHDVNGFLLDDASRKVKLQKLIADWQALSGASLDVDYFPARLLAIANRPDLANKVGYGLGGTAGEARFVFGLGNIANGECRIQDFTVIFEYAIKGGACASVKNWQQRWKNLDLVPLGSAPYRAALELITQSFTEHASNPSQLPNQSSLGQLRTNDGLLNSTWQLREFRLRPPGGDGAAGTLGPVTIKQTPDLQFRNTPVLAQYLQASEADILADKHVVPNVFPTALDPFLGASVIIQEGLSAWTTELSALAEPSETRRKFSLNTCSACHQDETGTFFTHIGSRGQRNLGESPSLSKFLTGTGPNFQVPVTGESHHYDDLQEREARMAEILSASCFNLLETSKASFSH